MGVLAEVDYSVAKFQKFVRANNGAIVNYDAVEENKVNHLLHILARLEAENQIPTHVRPKTMIFLLNQLEHSLDFAKFS